ncbi:unnamed protein product [Cuscuta campestris]|uniref:Retrovirus-related Pol polyprotein from transposon TNT 1-94-like beta-barrel domain-containing protein n=1 Tax=Cuscuta campestris TaxID=132261 RepID=A0A484NDW6_9ASTE|nr:unnamed protein product [Cuscuta campestris]
MRIFIQSNDYKLWLIVKNGCGVPMKKVGEVNVPKTEEEFTDEDCKKMELNAKAINMIYCGVNADDYRKISRCETAKQMWEKLEVTYEGTAQVREAKIDHLTHEYELFSMKENEKIEEMFERFSKIINPLNLLGKTYTDRELVRKVVEERNKRSIALPATTSTHNNVDDEDDDSDDTDLGLFVRKFKKMMLKKGAKKKTSPKCYGGCSKHMTGDASKFRSLEYFKGGNVVFGDNNKGRIIGSGTVGKDNATTVENVLLVEGLKHNLLSISQLCDKGSYDDEEEIVKEKEPEEEKTQEQTELPKEWRTLKNHPIDNVIGDLTQGVSTHFTRDTQVPVKKTCFITEAKFSRIVYREEGDAAPNLDLIVAEEEEESQNKNQAESSQAGGSRAMERVTRQRRTRPREEAPEPSWVKKIFDTLTCIRDDVRQLNERMTRLEQSRSYHGPRHNFGGGARPANSL